MAEQNPNNQNNQNRKGNQQTTKPIPEVKVQDSEVESTITQPLQIDPSVVENTPVEQVGRDVVLCPNPLNNSQLVRGLEGIREKFDNKNMSRAAEHHRDVYSALSRILTSVDIDERSSTITNLLNYINAHRDGHADSRNILQGINVSGLDAGKQKEYIKLMTIFVTLADPDSRGIKAKQINWKTFPAGLLQENAVAITRAFTQYFNIV